MDNSHQALCYRLFVFPIQRVSPRVLWQTSSNQPRESVIGLGTSEPLPRLQKTKLGTLQEWLWQSKLTLKHQLFHVFSFLWCSCFLYMFIWFHRLLVSPNLKQQNHPMVETKQNHTTLLVLPSGAWPVCRAPYSWVVSAWGLFMNCIFNRYVNSQVFPNKITMIEGSLEVKLPTIWTDEKQSREEAERRERLEERRVEEKE